MNANRQTTIFADAADRAPNLLPHQRAYFCWMAWIRFSSRSREHGAHFATLLTGGACARV